MKTSTLNALIGRGVDNLKAQELVKNDHTVYSLKCMSEVALKKIGLSNYTIDLLKKDNRPPIPSETVIKVLYESKRTCCVCRDSTKAIIIHHIKEWSISKSHLESNLVVLCLEHHNEAHSKKSLSLNLTPKQIIAFKKRWVESVKTQDSGSILGLMGRYSRWDYVNIQRVFELFLDLNINYKDITSYLPLKESNVLDRQGVFMRPDNWRSLDKPRHHLCDFSLGIYLMHYLKSIIERIVNKLPIVDITNDLNVKFIKSIVKPGTYIAAQVGYYFSDIDQFEKNGKQIRKGYYRKNSIRIEFVFDASECTSTSGRFDALTGHRVAVPIIFVRSVLNDDEGNLVINGSCIAIGTYFENHRQIGKLN